MNVETRVLSFLDPKSKTHEYEPAKAFANGSAVWIPTLCGRGAGISPKAYGKWRDTRWRKETTCNRCVLIRIKRERRGLR